MLATGSVTYRDVPAVDKVDFTTTKYHLYITHTGSTPTKPNVNWDHPKQVRCNTHLTKLGNESTGCVDNTAPEQPALELPISEWGAAAATYGWAQHNLPDQKGLVGGNPLHQTKDGDDRREITCAKFEKKPEILDDSCDEYPFASTKEGGQEAALCAEIQPVRQEDGKYKFFEAWNDRPVTYTEPCVRSHVNLIENTNAGGECGRYVAKWRLIEGDAFHLDIPDYFDMVVDAT
ncbi:NucA/NucB deoxyribonuclease domain-containing protein [Streptomyces sp. NPDC051740]|uniref:NucA/NucB deoxyribonuclease domain-containing protein n=1 Tax=Streptomyces sp. NPDC051740 TaxID=3365673 RepID=UPI003796C073